MDIKKIKDLTFHDEKSLIEMALKASEECGELAQATLSSQGVSGTKYKALTLEDVQEESVDVAIIALSTFFKAGGTMEELSRLFELKLLKWKTKIGK